MDGTLVEGHGLAGTDGKEVRLAYNNASREGLRRVAAPALAFLVLFGSSTGFVELYYFPERWLGLLLLNTAYLACGLVHVSVVRRRPLWTVPSTLCASWFVHLAVLTYFTAVHGSAELCLLILSALLTGQVIVHPWNGAGQLAAAIVPVIGFAVAQHLGLQSHLPAIYPLLALLTMVMLTTIGAARLDRLRFEGFARALQLERAADEQRNERALIEALLDLARAMNLAIGEPQRLTRELAEHTQHAVGADWVLVYRWAEDTQRPILAAAAGPPAAVAEELDTLYTTSGWSTAIEPLLASSGAAELLRTDPAIALPAALFNHWGIRTIRFQTVTREQRRIGIITCVRIHRAEPFTKSQRRILAAIATQAAVALENAALMEASRAAERVKGEFVATVSHELRTPLNVILGYTDLVLDGTFGDRPAEETDALERVRYHSLQLLELIQDLLDINRLEARGVNLSLRRFPISELIDTVRQDLPENWMRPAVTLNLDSTATAVVRSDRGKLEIILRNLIHNALKFTEQGSVTVGAEVLPDRAAVRLVVTDTGPGIPAGDLPLIFEMFGQGQAGPRAGGVGLGLYIVKRLADALGATIDVASTPGVGARFCVTLPVEPD